MLQGFWGGVILSAVNLVIVFLVLGGLAGAIVVVRKLLAWSEKPIPTSPPPPPGALTARRPPPGISPPRSQVRVAAIMAAVHAFTGAAPGALRLVGVTRVGSDSPWKVAGRMEGMGMDIGSGERLQS
jgi:hypothetical protein